MAIVVNLDVMMAKRKISLKGICGKNRYYKYKYDFAIWSWSSKKGSKFF
ncbi:hypothetical protein [Clostridioides difficile]